MPDIVSAVPESHRDLLRSPLTATLTTIDVNGRPQSSAVWYFVDDDGRLTGSITSDRQKYKNLSHNPNCDLFIIDPQDPFRTLEIPGRGRARGRRRKGHGPQVREGLWRRRSRAGLARGGPLHRQVPTSPHRGQLAELTLRRFTARPVEARLRARGYWQGAIKEAAHLGPALPDRPEFGRANGS